MSDNRVLERCYKQESKVSKKFPNIVSILLLLTVIFHYVVGHSPQQNHADPGTRLMPTLMSKFLMIQGLHLAFGHSAYHESPAFLIALKAMN